MIDVKRLPTWIPIDAEDVSSRSEPIRPLTLADITARRRQENNHDDRRARYNIGAKAPGVHDA